MRRLKTLCLAAVAMMVVSVAPWASSMATAQSSAGDRQPAVVISVASIQEQLDDIGYMFKGAGYGQFSGLINLQAKEFLKGIDLEKPIGAMIYFDEVEASPDVLVFVSMTNMSDFLNVIGQYAEVSEDGDITTITTDDGTEFSIREQGGIAFVSNSPDQLDDLPSDPHALLMELPEQYNMAARLFAQRIPEHLREMAMGFIREGMENQLNEMPEELVDIQRKNIEYQMAQMESLIHETEEVKLGFAINADSQSIYMDMDFVGADGSKIARQMEANQGLKQRFAGFIMDGSAFNACSCSRVAEEDAVYANDMLKEIASTLEKEIVESGELGPDEADAVNALVQSFFDVILKTVEKGDVNFGLVGRMGENVFDAAMAIELIDSSSLQDELEKVVPMIESRAEGQLTVRWNAAESNGADFHEFQIAIPEHEMEARKIFGEHITMHLGLGDDAAYFTFGSGGIELLDEALNNSNNSADLPLTQFNVHLTPILQFAAAASGDENAQAMADKMEESGKDRISVVANGIKNGVTMRFEIEDGFLGLIGIAAQQFGGGFGGNEF